MAREQFVERLDVERALAGEELVQQEAERVDVAAHRHFCAGQLLGCHVGGCPGADRFA